MGAGGGVLSTCAGVALSVTPRGEPREKAVFTTSASSILPARLARKPATLCTVDMEVTLLYLIMPHNARHEA